MKVYQRFLLCALLAARPAIAQIASPALAEPDLAATPWLEAGRSPDERADLLPARMTPDEKIQLLHGGHSHDSASSNGGAGFTPVTPDKATLTMKNTGNRAGVETAQIYAALPARRGSHGASRAGCKSIFSRARARR